LARDIDMNKPKSWSDDDVQYLRERGKLPDGFDVEDDLIEEDADDEEKAKPKKSKK